MKTESFDHLFEKEVIPMSLEHTLRAIAGTFILISVALGHLVNPYWFLFTAFVGANLLQSSFTKWCLMEDILKSTIYREKAPALAKKQG